MFNGPTEVETVAAIVYFISYLFGPKIYATPIVISGATYTANDIIFYATIVLSSFTVVQTYDITTILL